MQSFIALAFSATLIVPILSAPAPLPIVALSKAQVSAFRPYTFFAGTGYCPPNATLAWTCGENCLANPDFKPVAAGGDGEFVQYWLVGYSPSLKRVIVAHEGTRLYAIISLLTDASLLQTTLDRVLFPGLDSEILVHSGFAEEHVKTATSILTAVKTALAKFSADHITIVGHSLVRGALALLDSVYLPLHLPPSVKFSTVTYGMPRVGNPAFADYVDAHVSLTHINNQKDPVPILPSAVFPLLQYRQVAGEVHIQASGEWMACPGQENPSQLCSAGDVPDIFVGSIANHDGPYDAVVVSCNV
ncbi:lipase [Mycena vitilis]|nr:lipase [Mycena vitilis]